MIIVIGEIVPSIRGVKEICPQGEEETAELLERKKAGEREDLFAAEFVVAATAPSPLSPRPPLARCSPPFSDSDPATAASSVELYCERRALCAGNFVHDSNKIIASIAGQIMSEIRKTVESFRFVEVETPVLQGSAGGAEARPFVTYHNTLGRELFLRIATELHLKRMLVGSFEKVYEISRILRNEGISTRHNPEFTTIEMYEAYSDYESMMFMAEEIVTRCALAVHGKLTTDYQGTEISLERPWRRETMQNLVKEASGVDFGSFDDLKVAKEVTLRLLEKNLQHQDKLAIESCQSMGHILNEIFEIVVEPKLMPPTFVVHYPIEISPLAKPHHPLDQRARLEEQIRQHNSKRSKADHEENDAEQKGTRTSDDSYEVVLDDDFLTALEYGMPPASGMGLGIDRLVMLLTNSASIRDVKEEQEVTAQSDFLV
ncbi:Lysine--tRNA ligase, chloroplastic/mitochondrial-like protein [Drosera capensis]